MMNAWMDLLAWLVALGFIAFLLYLYIKMAESMHTK